MSEEERMEVLRNKIRSANRAIERGAIVAWLLRHSVGELSSNEHVQRAAKSFADAIERGDHLTSGETHS